MTIHFHDDIFEFEKAIFNGTITWSEMGQQTNEAKEVY